MKRRKKDPWLDGSIPLTESFANAVWTLMSAADLAHQLGEKMLYQMCLRETRLILRRGAPDATAPKAPSNESIHSLPSLPADSSPASEEKLKKP